MRGESDRKRSADFAIDASPQYESCFFTSSKLSDKENEARPRRRRPFYRPNEQFVCAELPVEEYSNKKPRGSGSSSEVSSRRSQAPKRSRHSYLKPGTLAKVRDAIGRKRFAERENARSIKRPAGYLEAGGPSLSPERVPAGIAPRWLGPACLQRKKLLAPKVLVFSQLASVSAAAGTSTAAANNEEDERMQVSATHSSNEERLQSEDIVGTSQSTMSLDSLPLELLVRIACFLKHEELKSVFHVCRSIRQAVIIARHCHFNYTTPGCTRKTSSDGRGKSEEVLPFLNEFAAVGISTVPNAPRLLEKLPKSRIPDELRVFAGPLFPLSPRQNVARRRKTRAEPLQRSLFNEEELCKAIAQNTL